MESRTNMFEPLLETATSYGKTSLELYKLKALNSIGSLLSAAIHHAAVAIILLMFLLFASMGAALWLGDILGEIYFGFFCVAAFYALAAIIVRFGLKQSIKKHTKDSFISKLLNK
ncbi:MAG: hypothetical protein K9G49_02225 [Taibaiella sp.]|nr:hypothetical protein [Taibaiella sp.]